MYSLYAVCNGLTVIRYKIAKKSLFFTNYVFNFTIVQVVGLF